VHWTPKIASNVSRFFSWLQKEVAEKSKPALYIPTINKLFLT
jgi:hypothetical protein